VIAIRKRSSRVITRRLYRAFIVSIIRNEREVSVLIGRLPRLRRITKILNTKKVVGEH